MGVIFDVINCVTEGGGRCGNVVLIRGWACLALSYRKSKCVNVERCGLSPFCSSHALIESEGVIVGKVAGTGLFCKLVNKFFRENLQPHAARRSSTQSGAAAT
jgi:hypothetical protein